MKRQRELKWLPQLCLGLMFSVNGSWWLVAAEVPAPPAVMIANVPPWPVGPFVMLRGGGVVAGRLRELAADRVMVDSVSCGTLDLPRTAVTGYRSSPRVGPLINTAGNATIWVTLANGDRVAATTVRSDGLVLWLDGFAESNPIRTPLEIPFERILGIDFGVGDTSALDSREAVALAALGCWVGLEDGSRFACENSAEQVSQAPEGPISLRPLLRGLAVPLLCPADAIAVVEPGGSRLRLALVEPEEGPAGALATSLTRGCTYSGDWPRLRGQTGFTAIGLHAPAAVRYRFDRPAVRFTATVGIDDTAGQGGSVRVRVLAGTHAPAQDTHVEVFRSPVISGGDAPLAIDLPLADATSLELQVGPADGGAVLDRTLWLDPQAWFRSAD